MDHRRNFVCSPESYTLLASRERGLCLLGQFPLGLGNERNVTHLYMTKVTDRIGHRPLKPKTFQDSLLCTKLPGMEIVRRKDSPAGFPCPQYTKLSLLEFLQNLESPKPVCLRRGRQIAVKSREERSHTLFLQLLVIPLALIFAMLFIAKILEITDQKEND